MKMKNKLTAFSLCALFGLALLTVHLKTREALLRYDIAKYEMYEKVLLDRLNYLTSEKENKAGVVSLLRKAVDLGIDLHFGDTNKVEVPLLTTITDGLR